MNLVLTEQEWPKLLCAGDSCIVVEFGNSISLDVNARVQALRHVLEAKNISGIQELVPTYRSLAVYFDPVKAEPSRFRSLLERLASTTGVGLSSEKGKVIVIPVCYGGEFGPDLQNVVKHTGLVEEEVIKRHSAPDYYCYMLGFTPGFSYLGGMDETIATPRLSEPRERIPAGSVGIAGKQTGIYPIDSPGGWQLIGRTPLPMFDANRESPTLVDAGFWIRFHPISPEEYRSIEEKIFHGNYTLEFHEKGEMPA